MSGRWRRWHSSGSSPLARGTRRYQREARVRGRFIPARAGNTPGSASRPTPPPVHPRSRGEHPNPPKPIATIDGSSPLARGTRVWLGVAVGGSRFIPARAGNTDVGRRGRRHQAVHPRSRGEHGGELWRQVGMAGSSPLARGTPTRRTRQDGDGRFIPARAGNTPPARLGKRGDSGSSPLARGTLRPPQMLGHVRRFIPARAGNTISAPLPGR